MKFRIPLYLIISLLILFFSIVWFIFSTNKQEGTKTLNATVDRDCAPWDGAAFTVSIPYDPGSVIDISIWQSPEIKLPVMFSFPDQTGRVGNAIYRPQFGSSEQLSGRIFFQHVEEDKPIIGDFSLTTENEKHFEGRFKAIWGDNIAMCG